MTQLLEVKMFGVVVCISCPPNFMKGAQKYTWDSPEYGVITSAQSTFVINFMTTWINAFSNISSAGIYKICVLYAQFHSKSQLAE